MLRFSSLYNCLIEVHDFLYCGRLLEAEICYLTYENMNILSFSSWSVPHGYFQMKFCIFHKWQVHTIEENSEVEYICSFKL